MIIPNDTYGARAIAGTLAGRVDSTPDPDVLNPPFTASDAELNAVQSDLQDAIDLKQDQSTAATDSELAALEDRVDALENP